MALRRGSAVAALVPPVAASIRQRVGQRQLRGGRVRCILAGRRVVLSFTRVAAEWGDREPFAATVCECDGVDDLEGSPVGECTNGARLERGHSTVRYKSLQSPLDATPIVGARYNFLTCITTFVERDAAECVEIEHLRDECFAGRAEDLR